MPDHAPHPHDTVRTELLRAAADALARAAPAEQLRRRRPRTSRHTAMRHRPAELPPQAAPNPHDGILPSRLPQGFP